MIEYIFDTGATPPHNSFADYARINALLSFHPKWSGFTQAEQEQLIKNVSIQLNNLMFYGKKLDPAQAMSFPREFEDDAPEFSLETQEKKLISAVAAQVEFNLNRVGMGMMEYAHGNESFIPRQETICREAKAPIAHFMRAA